jgi:hypothetical protein
MEYKFIDFSTLLAFVLWFAVNKMQLSGQPLFSFQGLLHTTDGTVLVKKVRLLVFPKYVI